MDEYSHDAARDLVPPERGADPPLYLWRHRRARPGRFTVIGDDGVAAVHQGPGLTADAVIAFEAGADAEGNGLGEQDPGYDLCVFDEHGRALALIHRRPGRADRVTRLDGEGRDDA